MLQAAFLPCATAWMTVWAPSTTSPPAKTFSFCGLQRELVDADRAPLGALDALVLAGAVELRVLADRGDDLVALDDELGALDGHRPAAAGGVGLAQFHALHLDAGDLLRVVGDDADGRDQELELDAFFLGLVDLGVVSGHLLARAAVEAGDLFGPLADRGAAGVHGREPAADDGHLLADMDLAVELELTEKVDGGDDAVGVLARDAHLVGVESPQGEEHGVVLFGELLELDSRRPGARSPGARRRAARAC